MYINIRFEFANINGNVMSILCLLFMKIKCHFISSIRFINIKDFDVLACIVENIQCFFSIGGLLAVFLMNFDVFVVFWMLSDVLQVYDNSKHWMSNKIPYVIWYQQCFTQNAQHITKNWMFSQKNSLLPNIFFLFVASKRFFSTQKNYLWEQEKKMPAYMCSYAMLRASVYPPDSFIYDRIHYHLNENTKWNKKTTTSCLYLLPAWFSYHPNFSSSCSHIYQIKSVRELRWKIYFNFFLMCIFILGEDLNVLRTMNWYLCLHFQRLIISQFSKF